MMLQTLSPFAEILYILLGAALVLYILTGSADLGAGLWSLLASGPRKADHRRAVQEAIAPIWEANHVWLIFVIVVMFSAFPHAFAVVSTALHIPLALALLGIVFRGSAFAFCAYDIRHQKSGETWERIFGWASILTPLMLGIAMGAVSTGEIRVANGIVTTGFLAGWLLPFSFLFGLFAVALSSMLAAVYLAADTDGDVQEDFRKRAIITEIAAGPIAGIIFLRSAYDAPELFEALVRSPWTWPIQLGAAGSAFATLILLYYRRFPLARFTAAFQVILVVLSWGLAMRWHFVIPDIDLHSAGSQAVVLPWLVAGIFGGFVLLVPALIYLYRTFKLKELTTPSPRSTRKR